MSETTKLQRAVTVDRNLRHCACCAAALLVLCAIISPAAALAVTVTPPILTKGLPLSISGQTEYPGEVAVWIIGRTFHDRLVVDAADGSFTQELLPSETTSLLPGGQYFLVVEDTGPDGVFALDIADGENTTVSCRGQVLFDLDDPETGYSDTAMALSETLDSPDIDDASVKSYFLVEEAWTRFDQVPDGHPGDLLRFAGSTNLPADYEIGYSVLSSSADPSLEEGISGSIRVVRGSSHNYWYIDLDTAGLKSGEYVLSLDTDVTGAATIFNLYDAGVVLPTTPPLVVETLGRLQDDVLPGDLEDAPAADTNPAGTAIRAEPVYTTGDAEIWGTAVDGDYIAWTEITDGSATSVCQYHIPSGTVHTILENADYLAFSIDISGDRVAWVPKRSDEVRNGFVLYNITTRTMETRPPGDCQVAQMVMDGDLIAFSGLDWSSADTGEFGTDIFLYSIADGTTQLLCGDAGRQTEPSIGEGYVAWRNTGEEFGDTITICSLADLGTATLNPADGASYGTPAVGGGIVAAPLHYRSPGTFELDNTEIVTTTLADMETNTLPIPEKTRRYNPQSNGEWIVWEEQEDDYSSRIVLYSPDTGTTTSPAGDSGLLHNPETDGNHIVATEYDEVRGSCSVWLITLPGKEQYPAGDAMNMDGSAAGGIMFPGYLAIGCIAIVACVMVVAVFSKRERT